MFESELGGFPSLLVLDLESEPDEVCSVTIGRDGKVVGTVTGCNGEYLEILDGFEVSLDLFLT